MAPLIEVRHLFKSFADTPAVVDLSLTVSEGEAYALVGPDGAGKTTAIRLMCGVLSIDNGEVTLVGKDLRTQTEEARAQIGYLPQRFSLYGDLTVYENLQFFAEVRGIRRTSWQPRSQEILEFVGLHDFKDRRAEALSGGMKQKLGLAAAIIHEPRVLLMDEPTGGVDPVTRQAFWRLVIQLLQEGVAILISTPYMDEASRCNKVGFMNEGKLLVEGLPDEIVQGLENRVVEVLGGPRRRLEQIAGADPEVQSVQAFGDRIHLRVASGTVKSVIRRLETSIRRQDDVDAQVQIVPPSLEDAYRELLDERNV